MDDNNVGRRMQICIAGSLKKSQCNMNLAAEWLKTRFPYAKIVLPHREELCMERAQDLYAKDLANCDLLIAIPKEVYYTTNGLRYVFGESTHYEMAFAEAQNIPVMTWTTGIEKVWFDESDQNDEKNP